MASALFFALPLILIVNQAEDIYKAFKPYYNATTLEEPSDPNHLEKLKHELNSLQVYLWSEVAGFCQVFYLPPRRQNPLTTLVWTKWCNRQWTASKLLMRKRERRSMKNNRLYAVLCFHQPDYPLFRPGAGDALQLQPISDTAS